MEAERKCVFDEKILLFIFVSIPVNSLNILFSKMFEKWFRIYNQVYSKLFEKYATPNVVLDNTYTLQLITRFQIIFLKNLLQHIFKYKISQITIIFILKSREKLMAFLKPQFRIIKFYNLQSIIYKIQNSSKTILTN